MSTGAVVAIVAVIVVLLVAVLVVVPVVRRRRLRDRFGPEYERAVESHDGRSAAERELREREKRHAELEIRPLPPDAQQRYTAQWEQVQVRFVDDPPGALIEADRLIVSLMSDRGYPTESYEQQVADLSVEHAQALDNYRAAHEIQERSGAGGASTEDMRTAMVYYRGLFDDLLGLDADRRSNVRSNGHHENRTDARADDTPTESSRAGRRESAR